MLPIDCGLTVVAKYNARNTRDMLRVRLLDGWSDLMASSLRNTEMLLFEATILKQTLFPCSRLRVTLRLANLFVISIANMLHMQIIVCKSYM
ncbi:hypothetical protein PUN28_000321 [Cardiocondyla obscurior]|uniref:Uncharacterized protein n=1 Tax=Cardiocondyla obscurior TaxID=286306 RepID=A0AAW2GYU2_9HYME